MTAEAKRLEHPLSEVAKAKGVDENPGFSVASGSTTAEFIPGFSAQSSSTITEIDARLSCAQDDTSSSLEQATSDSSESPVDVEDIADALSNALGSYLNGNYRSSDRCPRSKRSSVSAKLALNKVKVSRARTRLIEVAHNGALSQEVEPLPQTPESYALMSVSAYALYHCPYLSYLRRLLPWNDIAKSTAELVRTGYMYDFCWSPIITAPFLRTLLYEGYIPLGERLIGRKGVRPPRRAVRSRLPPCKDAPAQADSPDPSRITKDQSGPSARRRSCPTSPELILLMPKLHCTRCVVSDLNKLHIKSNWRKKSRRFSFSIDQAYDQVMEGILQQHGENWLYRPIRDALQALREHRSECSASFCMDQPLRVLSVEVWLDGEVVAGEVGVVMGKVFLSLSGFARVESSGSVQLAALGSHLRNQGFTMWDLGMSMQYKLDLGAADTPRNEFIKLFHQARAERMSEEFFFPGMLNCHSVIGPAKVQ